MLTSSRASKQILRKLWREPRPNGAHSLMRHQFRLRHRAAGPILPAASDPIPMHMEIAFSNSVRL